MRFQALPLAALTALLADIAVAVCTSSQNYVQLPNFGQPRQCVPTGYYQATDLGNTNPDDLTTRCRAQCASDGTRCTAYVGKLQKAADSNLYSGQCYFYSSTPSGPAQCADYPTIIKAEQKDTIANCFSSSAAVATAYCSSYLSIGTVTRYVATTTIVTSTSTSVLPATSSSTTSTTSVATTVLTTSVSTSSTTTSTTITSTTSQTTTLTFTTSTTTEVSTSSALPPAKRSVGLKIYEDGALARRAAAAPTPACVQSFEPTASISSACSCLSITSTTVFLTSTVSVATSTSTTRTTTTTSTAVVLQTSRSTISSSTVTTIITTSTTLLTQKFTTSTTTTSISATTINCPVQVTPNANAYSAQNVVLTDNGPRSLLECCGLCYAPGSGCTGFYSNNNGGTCYTFKNAQTAGTTSSQCPNGKGSVTFQFAFNFASAANGPCYSG